MRLVDKLKPEYKVVFEKNNLEYPSLVERVINCFEQLEYASDIPYCIWMDIKFFTNVYSPFELFTDNI